MITAVVKYQRTHGHGGWMAFKSCFLMRDSSTLGFLLIEWVKNTAKDEWSG